MKRLTVLLVLALVLGFAASANLASPTAQAQDDLKIVVIGKSVAAYWSNVEMGTQAAAEALGLSKDQVIFFVPSQEDVAAQIGAMETYIGQGVTGIAIAPSDPVALEPVMVRAAEAGILVTTLDTPPVEDSVSLVYIGTDNYTAGTIAGAAMLQLLPEGGLVGIGRGSDTALNALQRTDGFLDAIEGSDIETLEPLNDREDPAGALQLASTTISANPDLVAAFGVYAYNGPAWATAVIETGKVGEIKIVAFDATADIIDFIKGGVIDATIAQREYDMGYRSVEVIKMMSETSVEEALEAAGTVDGVIDTGVDIVTAASLKDYEASLNEKGIPHDWDTEDWEAPEGAFEFQMEEEAEAE
jgi:ribose transport system substrate-binding protein